jgi:hypothetical protein
MHLGQRDIDDMDVTELDWKYGWLIKQKEKEAKAASGKLNEESRT